MRLHVVIVIIFFERPPIIWIDCLNYIYADVDLYTIGYMLYICQCSFVSYWIYVIYMTMFICMLLDICYIYANVHLYPIGYMLYICQCSFVSYWIYVIYMTMFICMLLDICYIYADVELYAMEYVYIIYIYIYIVVYIRRRDIIIYKYVDIFMGGCVVLTLYLCYSGGKYRNPCFAVGMKENYYLC